VIYRAEGALRALAELLPVMSLLSLRSRLLQSLILALIGLTFYTYYRTTASEIRQYAFVRSYSEQRFFYPFTIAITDY
jgi:hypothetical protein